MSFTIASLLLIKSYTDTTFHKNYINIVGNSDRFLPHIYTDTFPQFALVRPHTEKLNRTMLEEM